MTTNLLQLASKYYRNNPAPKNTTHVAVVCADNNGGYYPLFWDAIVPCRYFDTRSDPLAPTWHPVAPMLPKLRGLFPTDCLVNVAPADDPDLRQIAADYLAEHSPPPITVTHVALTYGPGAGPVPVFWDENQNEYWCDSNPDDGRWYAVAGAGMAFATQGAFTLAELAADEPDLRQIAADFLTEQSPPPLGATHVGITAAGCSSHAVFWSTYRGLSYDAPAGKPETGSLVADLGLFTLDELTEPPSVCGVINKMNADLVTALIKTTTETPADEPDLRQIAVDYLAKHAADMPQGTTHVAVHHVIDSFLASFQGAPLPTPDTTSAKMLRAWMGSTCQATFTLDELTETPSEMTPRQVAAKYLVEMATTTPTDGLNPREIAVDYLAELTLLLHEGV